MAHTRLFAAVARALRAAVAGDRATVPRAGVSRRAFLQGAGAAVGALAASRALTACNVAQTDARIVVVGAGLAGLTVAYRLTAQGFAPTVYEASNRVGGRCLTDRDSAFNNRVDLGGEFIDSDHAAMLALAAELSMPTVDLAATYDGLTEEAYGVAGMSYTVAQMTALFAPIAPLLAADFARQGSGYADAFSVSAAASVMDHMSIREWFDARGATLDPALRAVLDAAYTSEYGLDTDQQSYLNLLYLISTDPTDFSLYGTSDGRFVLRDGADALTTALAAQLATPPQLGMQLTAVRANPDGTLTATFTSPTATAPIDVDADKVVLALPFNQLRRCAIGTLGLSNGQSTAIAQLRYGTTTKVVVATSSRVWVGQRSAGTSYNDGVYNESWDASRGFPGTAGIMVGHSGGALGVALATGDEASEGQAFVARLETVFPGVAAAYTGTVAVAGWSATPFIEGSYACYGPGDRTGFGGYEMQQAGNVHFAGEHTSEAWQGSMNGAVDSGERVAQEILNDLGA